MAAKTYVHKRQGYQVQYVLYFPDGTSVIRYRYFQNKTDADVARRNGEFLERGSRSGSLSSREIVQARHDGLMSDKDVRAMSGGRVAVLYDLDRVMSNYLASIAVTHTPVALDKASRRAKWIAGWLEAHPIPELTDTQIKQYILDRRSGAIIFRNPRSTFARVGVKPKTIKNELEIFIGIVDEAKKLGMVDDNVVRSVSLPVKTSTLRRSMNRAEVLRLIAAAEESRHMLHGQLYEFVMVALYTGFRRAELRSLTWDDINLETRRIFVQSKEISSSEGFDAKSGEARYKSISDILYPVLAGMERRGRFVFSADGDHPYCADVISPTVKKIMGKAGLPSELSLHHCRHTYGSWLLRLTGDLKLVQDEMGHLDISTTKNYMHNIGDESDPARTFSYD